jgi:hypothetical protein
MLIFDDWFDCKTKNYVTGVKILTPKRLQLVFGPFYVLMCYTAGEFVWCDRPLYLVKQHQEKWAFDFHDEAPPLSFQLQVAEVIF